VSAILDKLLKGQNVEWHTIEQIFHLRNGYTPSKSNEAYWTNGTIPWFRMEDIRENGNILDSALQQISESAVKGNKLFPKNSFIIATSATIGEHALITVPYLANQRFTNLSLKDDFINRFNIYFLYYYLFKLDEWCRNNTTMSSFASVDMNGFRKFEIPIPPLNVQDEIVRILDAFTAVTAELTAELNMREKQYQYYRDKLLSFSDMSIETDSNRQQQTALCERLANNVKQNHQIIWKSLGEIANFMNGKGHEKDIHEFGNYIVVNSKFISSDGQVAKYTNMIF
jgi:type I restriction enzyme S subunit